VDNGNAMKKIGKILFITVLTLFAVLIVTVSVVSWLVFTPERITPIVRKQVSKFITCKSEIGQVELTFFSTFPDIGFRVSQFALINPAAGAPSDTLVKVNQLVFLIDAAEWWKKNKVVLTGLELSGGSVNIFSDSLGKSNYDIMPPDTATYHDTGSETELPDIDIRNVLLKNVDLRYDDRALMINTIIRDLTAKISGTIQKDSINGLIRVSRSVFSLEYSRERYLDQASVQFDLPVDIIPSRQFIRFKNARASINDLEFFLSGDVENDTIKKNINTNIRYSFSSWHVKKLLTLIPPSFGSYVKGLEADGRLSSQGSIKGFLNDSVMPVLDIHMLMEKGAVQYTGFPLPLHDIEGDITIYTDLKTDSLSFLKINRFSAKTPLSTIRTEGMVRHLFKDIYFDMTTDAGLILDEFNPMIPDSMKIDLKGKASGKVKSAFSLTQLEKMQIERMKLSGSVTLSDFNFNYDSISLKTDRSAIDFALPNFKSSSSNTKFAFAKIEADNLETGKLTIYNAFLKNASLTFETSDVRDTTRIPWLNCSFIMDTLSAKMDTISIDISRPHGKVSLAPISDRADQSRIILSYNSDQLKTIFGQSSALMKKINLETDILNDNTQKDIFLQWLARGFIDMSEGTVRMAGLSHPVEIPSVKMNFDPETFNIKESRIKIDKSDFQLTGTLNNVLSYFRGDSILKGSFSFVSDVTDISQLMAVTSGIGYADSTGMKNPESPDVDTTYTGPYMVPKGMDLSLNVKIRKASIGADTATNIAGIVQVHNGVLMLDGLSLETPAARMQLTVLYRTPRKNHLYLGLDYHMLDVEIGELLTMIPDIDSLMPMLRSFGGRGEFHIAVETYLDSLYNLKKSTLRGAASIKGNDLILMDGETFSEIAKKLKFNKKTENRVDSLSAEFTIFRNEIDIYPFLIVMDKYKAVIAGRHNFDLSFDYHISVVDSPLPIKLGIDVKGNMDELSYSLAKCRYAEYYRPTSRRVVENKQLELRRMIRETLTQKVKE
jgi:hypothetical protein